MKDKDSKFLFEAYAKTVLKEEYHDCYKDCIGLGGTPAECEDECAHLEEEGTGSGHENEPGTIKQRGIDRKKLQKSNPDLARMRAQSKKKMGLRLTPDDKRALGKGDVIEDDEEDYRKRAHAAGEKFGKSGMKMFVDPDEDDPVRDGPGYDPDGNPIDNRDDAEDSGYSANDMLGYDDEAWAADDPDQSVMDREEGEEAHPNKEWLNLASAFIHTAMAGDKDKALDMGETLLQHYDGHPEEIPMDPELVMQMLRASGASEEELAHIESPDLYDSGRTKF
mgnify:CR=1 FL=1|tara:strand:+ start:2125 stop:2961 length:837 start_codon:yes stop_codon:yes gene_type:complete